MLKDYLIRCIPFLFPILVPLLASLVGLVAGKIQKKVHDEKEAFKVRTFDEFLGLSYYNDVSEKLKCIEEPEPQDVATVRCEYCDSYVESGANCPNCGAVLPRACDNKTPHATILQDGSWYFGNEYADIGGNGEMMSIQSRINQLETQTAMAYSARYPNGCVFYQPYGLDASCVNSTVTLDSSCLNCKSWP